MIWGLADKPLAGARNRGGDGGGVSWRWSSPAARGSGGKARGRQELLGGGLVEVGGGRERGRRRSSGLPAVANGGGAAPAALGGGELAVEVQQTMRKQVWGSI